MIIEYIKLIIYGFILDIENLLLDIELKMMEKEDEKNVADVEYKEVND